MKITKVEFCMDYRILFYKNMKSPLNYYKTKIEAFAKRYWRISLKILQTGKVRNEIVYLKTNETESIQIIIRERVRVREEIGRSKLKSRYNV